MHRQHRNNFIYDIVGTLHTFVEQEVAFLHNVFVESIFCFPPDSVINFSAIHCVSKNLLLVLQEVQNQVSQ